MFKHILVPLDGSLLAESALPVTSYIAKTLNASVTLFHVIEKDAPKAVHGETHLHVSFNRLYLTYRGDLIYKKEYKKSTILS
jgi:nucleotide-binding universal stress UspA family protein